MKRGQLNAYLVSIIGIMLSFIVIVGFYKFYLSKADTKADAIACNSLIRGVDKLGKLTFLVNVRNKCRTSQFEIRSSDKEVVFKEIAEAMRETWFKYGEGKYDFMSKFSGSRKWCFLGAVVKFDKSVDGERYISVDEFNKWLKNNKFKDGDKEIGYLDYFNYERYDGNDKEYEKLKDLYLEMLNEAKNDKTMELPAIVASNEFFKLSMLKDKRIDTEEDLYVVYVFERPSRDLGSQIKSAMFVGVGSAVATDVLLFWIPGKALDMVKDLGTVAKFFEVLSLVRRVSGFGEDVEMMRFLQPAKWQEVKSIVDESGDVVKLAELERAGSLGQLLKETATVEKGYESVSEALRVIRVGGGYSTDYDALMAISKGINNKETKEIADKILEIMADSGLKNVPNDPNVLYNSLKPKDRKVYTELTDLVFKRPISIEEDKEGVGFLTGLRRVLDSAALIGGGYVGARYNSDNVQYIALMSPEEYYMVCGG